MKDYRRDHRVLYMQTLQFEPQAKSGDPGRLMMSKQELQRAAEEG